MNLNKEFLSEVIKYLISRGVTIADVMDTFNEHFNTLDAFNDSLKNMPTKIERGTINNVIEEPVLPKYTMTESDKVRLESVSLSPETLNKVFDTSKCEVRKPITDIDWLLCGRSVEESSTPCQKVDSNRDLCQKVKKNAENTEKPVNKSRIDYPKTVKNHGIGVSPARKALFDVINGKTVIEHLKENGITYSNFDNRIRKNWSVENACTTPLTKVVKPYTRAKKSEEPTAVIIPDNVKVAEEETTSRKTKMMLVDGRMTELEVSDTDLIQSNFEKPVETLETQTETLETQSNTENTAENVTNEPQAKTDTDTRVNDANANSDAKNSESERIEQLADKTVRDIVTGKNREKKKTEPKRDYTASDLCLKLGLTTHELREKIEMGEIPQPDCGNKWSAKLLKDKDIILFF